MPHMAKKLGLGPVRRFGPRYGRTVKHKLAKIEAEQKKKHTCPYCDRSAVKRKAAGIWHCNKCESTFTARAYTVGSRPSASKRKLEVVAEEIEIEE